MDLIRKTYPNYLNILSGKQKPRFQISKDIDKKIKQVEKILENCELCSRKCHANRFKELGFCGVDLNWKIFGAHTHWGEENELIPSATLFMAGCNMRCAYCQNAPGSINPEYGEKWTEKQGAKWIDMMFNNGCKNVNFVGGEPTPYLYNILKCLKLVKANIPVVWNSNSYYSEKTAEILKDIVDIYLLDFRYFSDDCAIKYSNTPNYLENVKRNFLTASKDSEMLIRVLVMPSHIKCCAKPILNWIRDNIGELARVNIMAQYYPTWNANEFPEMNRRLTSNEYNDVLEYAEDIGLKNLA